MGLETDWINISAGGNHSLAIKKNGTLWAWGQNDWGQLGIGSTIDQILPTQVGTRTNWKTVSGGWQHSIALKTDGTLWAWGSGSFWSIS